MIIRVLEPSRPLQADREWQDPPVLALALEDEAFADARQRWQNERGEAAMTASRDAPDFYELLGVSREATPEAIKRQYYILARRMHPDKNPNDPNAKDRFQRLGEAYQVGRWFACWLAARLGGPCWLSLGWGSSQAESAHLASTACVWRSLYCICLHTLWQQRRAERRQTILGGGGLVQVLGNPELRERYDRHGTEGLDVAFMDSADLFVMLFGSDRFEHLIGELTIAAQARSGHDMAQAQQRRVQVRHHLRSLDWLQDRVSDPLMLPCLDVACQHLLCSPSCSSQA